MPRVRAKCRLCVSFLAPAISPAPTPSPTPAALEAMAYLPGGWLLFYLASVADRIQIQDFAGLNILVTAIANTIGRAVVRTEIGCVRD